MPSQSVEVMETIAAVKRALKRGKEAPSDLPILSASNRGNKLKYGARHVHEGWLAPANSKEIYKQKVEHAGYTRYILARNPRRYNEYGDELDDSESDMEADMDAADENAYSGIRLEDILCPLKHPSELPVHPTMSHAYLDNALLNMVKSTQDQLRHERATLWKAKALNRQLMGDATWMPCGAVESPEDWDMFQPSKKIDQSVNGGKKRKREQATESDTTEAEAIDIIHHVVGPVKLSDAPLDQEVTEPSLASLTGQPTVETGSVMTKETVQEAADGDIKMADEPEAKDSAYTEHAEVAEMAGAGNAPGPPAINGEKVEENSEVNPAEAPTVDERNNTEAENPTENEGKAAKQGDQEQSEADDATPPPPARRITRALAAESADAQDTAATPPDSPTPTLTSDSSSSLLQIDPLFLIPPSAQPSKTGSALYGLPADEAGETRKLLTTYIQKQEESVRGLEAVLSKLMKAKRLRNEVLEMCKAEGHIGEMSDGEDWIDYEQWNLQPGELRKGRDEDEDAVEENTIGGRKGKRRARN